MKMCPAHWLKIRNRITELGLYHLVAKSGREAHAQMVAELEGREEKKDYDPLMSCHWMITNRALEMGGLGMMMQPPPGEGWIDEKGQSHYCPICEAVRHRNDGKPENEPDATEEDVERFWIEGPTQAALSRARELGLVPKQQ